MAAVGMQKTSYFPQGMSPHFIPPQPQNLEVLPVPPANDGQLEDHLDIDIPQLVGDVAGQGRLHDPHHVDVAYRGVVGYHPPPLHDPAVQYIFPDVGHDQGINAQVQPNAPGNQGHSPFVHARVSQHAARGPDPAVFHDPFVHQIPAAGQPLAAAENIRQLASRYLNHPDSRVDMFYMEPGAAGDCDVMIKLKIPNLNVLAITTAENRF